MQILTGGFGVTKLKLNGLAFLHEVPDGDRAGLLVCADEVAHQEIAAFKAAAMFINGDADV
jgi:hypothetical protein